MKTLYKIALSSSTILTTALLASAAQAQNLPIGGSVAAGSARINAPSGTTQTITQTSDRAVINWTSFDVSAGHNVVFAQPNANSATLNRVTGTTGSTIAGEITANGSVYLINPNGIQITSTGTVNVGRGFVASTLDMTDGDFMAGNNVFSGTGSVLNLQGSITTGTGGFVGLLGGEVRAGGTIVAPAGTVMIGTSTTATLDLNGNNFLQVVLPTSAVLGGNGTVSALTAAAARNAVRHMVNLPTSVEATAISGTNGNVTLSGSITAASGSVIVAGMGNVALNGATLDVAGGQTGGSSVVLRPDAIGVGTPVVTITNASSMTTNAAGTVDIYHNPASYAAPTNYSSHITGGGTLNTWMLVNNVDQLQAMGTNMAGNYALGRDIDASDTMNWNGGTGFAPVGNGSAPFTGKFDGLGHIISDLMIRRPAQNNVGLFGSTRNALLRNVGLSGGTVQGGDTVGMLVGNGELSTITNAWASGKVSGTSNVGGLVGSGRRAVISNVWASGEVSGTSNVGGLVGSGNRANITNAWASGAVLNTGQFTGGLIGLGTEATISNAWASGAVSGDYTVGGLVGYGYRANISNAWASGAVSGSNFVGGLVGIGTDVTISNAYWDSYSSGQVNGIGTGAPVSSNLAPVTSDPRLSGAANYAFTQSAYGNFDFSNNWFMVDGNTRPIQRSQHSINITNPYQLQLMVMDLGAHYTLAHDIDMSETARAANATAPGGHSGVWNATGFVPVVRSSSIGQRYSFTGHFDGLGHVISDLTIRRPTNGFVGLFGYASGATIENVGLKGSAVSGVSNVGGLIGHGSDVTITNAWVSGEISGISIGVGGLIGGGPNSTITNAWVSGEISGTHYVGGLVGDGYNTAISNAWASGEVSGGSYVGGLVGWGHNSTINNTWTSSAVSGAGVGVGRLVGNGDNVTITNTRWDSYISGPVDVIGEGTPNSTSNLAAVTSDPSQSSATNYAYNPASWGGFDLDTTGGQDTVWRMYEGHTFPLLKVFMAPLTINVSGGGTATYNGSTQSGTAGYDLPAGADPSLVQGALVGGRNAGTYTVGIDGLYSTQLGYDLITGTTGSLTITPAALTITGASATGKIYDGTTSALLNGGSLSGVIGTDAVTLTLGTGSFVDKNAGTGKAVSVTGNTLSGVDAGNYTLAALTGLTADITPAALTLSAVTDSKIYDGTASSVGTITVAGLVGNDDVSGLSQSFDSINAGDRTLAVNTWYSVNDGNGGNNYSVTTLTANGTINPAALTVTYIANSVSSIYGNAIGGLNGTTQTSGLVNGDTLSGTAEWMTTAGAASDVGSYGVTGSGLTASSNYTLITLQAAGNATALTISPRPITVTANNQSRMMGLPNPALTWAITNGNLVNNDQLTGALATLADTSSTIGNYAITQGSLGAPGNYLLTFMGGELSVTPMPSGSVWKIVSENSKLQGGMGDIDRDENAINPLDLNVNFSGSGDSNGAAPGDGTSGFCQNDDEINGSPCPTDNH